MNRPPRRPFPVGGIVRHVSAMTLYPVDVLLTGTPAGGAIDGPSRQRQEPKPA